jgi:hypothetical protein
MKARRFRVFAAVGLSTLAMVTAISLGIGNAFAQQQVNTGAPPGSQITPTYTDLSTLIIAGYESPETSTVVGEPGAAR